MSGRPASCVSPIGMYGRDRDHFVKRLNEGYTEIAIGGGPWVDMNGEDLRIVGIWVFYHPDGRVATIETHKGYTPDGHTIRGCPTACEYKTSRFMRIRNRLFPGSRVPKSFERLVKDYHLKLGPREPLKDLLDSWSGEIKRD